MTSRKLSAEVGTRVARALGRMVGDGFSVELPYMNDAGVHWFCSRSAGESDMACLTVSVHQGRPSVRAETSSGSSLQARNDAITTVERILEGR